MARINIEAEAQVDNAIRGLGSLSKAADQLGDKVNRDAAGALGVFGISLTKLSQPLTATAELLKVSIDTTTKYASTVRSMSRDLGISAEETSRLIQVSDDYKISTDSLQGALNMAVKKGFEPSIDSLAKLADQYNATAGPTQKAAMLTEIFGKNWTTLTPLLEAGGDAIRSQAAAIDQSLIMTQAQVDKTRQYELAVDSLSDKWEALKITIGTGIIPTLTAAAEAGDTLLSWNQRTTAALTEHKASVLSTAESYSEYVGELLRAESASGRLSKQHADAYTQQVERGGTLSRQLTAYLRTLGVANEAQFNLTNTTQGYNAALMQVGQALYNHGAAIQTVQEQTVSLAEIEAGLAAGLQGQYGASLDAYNLKMMQLTMQFDTNKNGVVSNKEATDQYKGAVDAASAALQNNINQLVYQQAASALDAAGQLELARSMGLVDETSYNAAAAVLGLTEQLQNGTINQQEFIAATNQAASDIATYGVSVGAIAPQAQVASDAIDKVNAAMAAAQSKTVTFTTNVVTNTIDNVFTNNQMYVGNGVSVPAGQTGHAAGGREFAGMPRLVGERGPEMFIPDSGGYTVTNADTQKMIQLLTAIAGGVKGGMRSTTYNMGGSGSVNRGGGGGGNARALAGAF